MIVYAIAIWFFLALPCSDGEDVQGTHKLSALVIFQLTNLVGILCKRMKSPLIGKTSKKKPGPSKMWLLIKFSGHSRGGETAQGKKGSYFLSSRMSEKNGAPPSRTIVSGNLELSGRNIFPAVSRIIPARPRAAGVNIKAFPAHG
ncbi:hypothetical protein EVAR_62068_1 [Eumeta japonica]|uniref:Uncharacterized protein n=1 Tax=Eumeta variegata TaxID=151549 RepID=A0A4C1YXN3_EUMVA|nr:hypothetical protein EVAR_62068_1 [Eumeta japonica]